MSVDKPAQELRPVPGGLPFNNLPGPLSPQDALRLPGDNIIKRIFWAMLMMAALKAHAGKHRAIMSMKQEELEEHIEKELKEHKKHHPLHHYVGRQEGGPGHEEGFDAGEIDENYHGSPEALAMYENHDDKNKAKETNWIKKLIRVYYITYLIIYTLLGMKRNEDGELSDKALDDWLVGNQHKLEFRQLKMHLLNSLSEHSPQFDLVQIEFAERFLNRLTATLLISGKTLQDVQAVNQVEFGKALSEAYSQQMKEMDAVSNEMVHDATNAVAAAGIELKPAVATPSPTPTALNRAVSQMGPAQHPEDHGQHLAMQRLATVHTMFPKVPKPQNTQRRDHEKQTGHKHAHAKKPGHDLAKFNTNEAMGGELEQYANAIGVDPRVLEQGADHTRMKLFKEDGPEHEPGKKAMRETSAVSQREINAPSKLSRAPKPAPPMPKGA
ncbi:MAG: hypothetical protein ACHQAX_04595 [Gammaproteobacteria bacterium]